SWLDHLLTTFSDFPSVGLVGSKLILPNGKLQEAGSVIGADATARNYGREGDPQNYLYNYAREVDYVSGASMMIPKKLWEDLGGFDPKYRPAYYEDVDLAFRVRKAGYRVFYQPLSQVTHYEGGSNGTDVEKGIKRYQVINQAVFYETWKDVIASHGPLHEEPGYLHGNRYAPIRILYIDDGIPKSDHYAGAFLSEFYVTSLRRAGYGVTFLPHIDLRYSERYARPLQQRGVECVYEPYVNSSAQYLRQNGSIFDYVIISRANVAQEVIDLVKEFAPNAKVLFNSIDLHFLRLERAAGISGREKDKEIACRARESELSVIKKCDCTLVVSDEEGRLLADVVPECRVRVVPFPADIHDLQSGLQERKNVVFVGGFMHQPNVDAVLYFAGEVWPGVLKRVPGARLLIAGADAP
ncbi:glycosyl transferase, partial [bacterium]|nr:glycosyl transferase [bacterium]